MELDNQTRKNEEVPNPIDELSNVELIQRYRFDRNSIEYITNIIESDLKVEREQGRFISPINQVLTLRWPCFFL